MKILHILPAYSSTRYGFEGLASQGGGERYAAQLARVISQHADTTLLTFGPKDAELKVGDLKIKYIKSRPFLPRYNGRTDFPSLRLFGEIKHADIIHAHQYYSDSTMIAAIAAKMSGKKLFVTDHGFRGLNVARYFPAKTLSNSVLSLTNYEKQRFKTNKFAAIGGGVDLSKYIYNANKKNKVIFVGRLLPHKGVNYLIEALDPNVECVIAGHASHQGYFELLRNLAKGKNVNFLISASDLEVRRHISSASALVLPSVDIDVYGKKHNHPELFGLVVAEAFACGTPAIVSDSSALPFVVEDGKDGFVVPQNDPAAIRNKINYLFHNPEVVRAMSVHARAKAEKEFDWQIVAKRCLMKYQGKKVQ
jgi:glycosyltransferase involved in cell wall biosynthesis